MTDRNVEEMKEVPCMDLERIKEGSLNDKLLNSRPQTSFGLLGNLYCYKAGWERARQAAGRAEVDSARQWVMLVIRDVRLMGCPFLPPCLNNCLPSSIDQWTAATYYRRVLCVH